MKKLMLALSVAVISPFFHPVIATERAPQQAPTPSTEMGTQNYLAFSDAIRRNQLDVAQSIAEKTKSPFAKRALNVKRMTSEMSWPNVLETAKNLEKYDKFIEDSKPSPLIETKKEEESEAPQATEPQKEEETGSPQATEQQKEEETVPPQATELQKEEEIQLSPEQHVEDSETSAIPKQPDIASDKLSIKEMETFYSNTEDTVCQKMINLTSDNETQKNIKEKVESDKNKLASLRKSALSRIFLAKGIRPESYDKYSQKLLIETSDTMYQVIDNGIQYCHSQARKIIPPSKLQAQRTARKAQAEEKTQETTGAVKKDKLAEARARLQARNDARRAKTNPPQSTEKPQE